MAVYGNYINQNIHNYEYDNILLNIESVAYNEYINVCNLLESCSLEDKQYLKEKAEILLEISFKDIKDKFLKIIKWIKEKIKQMIDKIKSFFTDKKRRNALDKIKKTQKEITNLKRNDTKIHEDINEENRHLSLISKAQKIASNIYLYYSSLNYINASELSADLSSLYAATNRYKVIDDPRDKHINFAMEEIEKFSNLRKYIRSDIPLNDGSDYLTHTYVNYIEKDLEKRIINVNTLDDVEEIIERCNTILSDDYKFINGYRTDNILTCNKINNNIEVIIERYFKKIDYSDIPAQEIDKRTDIRRTQEVSVKEEFKDQYKFLHELTQTLHSIIKLMSVMLNMEGKAFGIATTAAIILE